MTESTLCFYSFKIRIIMRNVTLWHLVQLLLTGDCGSIQSLNCDQKICYEFRKFPQVKRLSPVLDNITASSGRETDRTERSHVRASEREREIRRDRKNNMTWQIKLFFFFGYIKIINKQFACRVWKLFEM